MTYDLHKSKFNSVELQISWSYFSTKRTPYIEFNSLHSLIFWTIIQKMFLSLPNLLLTSLIQLLLLPNIQSCPYLTSLDSSPGGKLAESNLRGNHGSDYHHDNRQLQSVSSASSSSPTSSPSYPTSTSSNPFCVHRLIPFVSRPMDVLRRYLQKAFRQLSRQSRHFSIVIYQLIHWHYPISLLSLFDWLFTMPVKLISRTPPTSWDLMDALVTQL